MVLLSVFVCLSACLPACLAETSSVYLDVEFLCLVFRRAPPRKLSRHRVPVGAVPSVEVFSSPSLGQAKSNRPIDNFSALLLAYRLALFVRKVTRRTWRFTTEHVVPQTDKECRFSLARTLEEKRPFCSPRKYCAFHYKVWTKQ